jgi:hypothetical protein
VVTVETTGETALGYPRSHDSASSIANLLQWLFRKRWNFNSAPQAGTLGHAAKARVSIGALVLIGATAWAWSAVATAGFMGWDPHFYYSLLEDKTWAQTYPFEQSMFWIISAFGPSSFASYEFFAIAISLSILLFAFYRLRYSPLDQLVLIFFFSSSFYGLHFMVAFQRQFFGFVLFLFAVSGVRLSLPARVASLFSQLFTFALHIFWELRRFSPRATAAAVLLIVPIAMALAGLLPDDKAAHYGGYGEDNPLHLVLKQALTVGFCLIVLATLEHGDNALRSLTTAYVAFSLPVVFWPFYAGVFARLDYFFFPLLVAFWPRHVRDNRRLLSRLCILGFTAIGFVLWIKLNLRCEVMGDCPL